MTAHALANTFCRGRRLLTALGAVASLATGTAAAWADPLHMELAAVVTEASSLYKGTDHMETRLKEILGAENVEFIVHKGTLGKGERQLWEAVQLGTLTGAFGSTGPLASFVPEADLFSMPFLFKNPEHAFAVVDGEVGAWFNEKMLEKGFRVLGWWTIGTRNTSNSVRPIEKPEDYAGMKIRTMESPPFIELYKAMGASPVPMAITEVYSALQQGTIDGIDGSLPAQLEFKHIEVLQYAAVTDHVVLLNPLVVSESWWQGLTEEQRAAITTVEAEARAIQRKADSDYNATIEEAWLAQGKTVSHPDVAAFQAIAAEIYPMFYETIGGEETVRKIQEIGEEY
jgi:tripartite ATP-independent transporter DctP family solute receptor